MVGQCDVIFYWHHKNQDQQFASTAKSCQFAAVQYIAAEIQVIPFHLKIIFYVPVPYDLDRYCFCYLTTYKDFTSTLLLNINILHHHTITEVKELAK